MAIWRFFHDRSPHVITDWSDFGRPFFRLPMPRTVSQLNAAVSGRRISARKGPVGGRDSLGESAAVPNGMITSEMKGNLPPFNDWMGHLSEGNHLYMFGGCRPNDTKPTSDFYLCDIRSMEWTNLTVRCLHPRAT